MAEGGVSVDSIKIISQITSFDAVRLLRDSGFNFIRKWKLLAGNLRVSLDTRKRYHSSTLYDNCPKTYEEVTEECIDKWIANEQNYSWELFISCLKKVDSLVAHEFEIRLNCGNERQVVPLYLSSVDGAVDILNYYESQILYCLNDKDTFAIVKQLVEEDVFPDEALQDMSGDNRVKEIWKRLEDISRRDIKLLSKFIRILSLSGGMNADVALTIQAEINFVQEQSNPVVIPLSPSYDGKLTSLQGDFGSMCMSVEDKILNANVTKPQMKRFIKFSFANGDSELLSRLEKANEMEDLIDILIQKCSLINVACLEKVAKHFKIELALTDIEGYMVKVNDFCDEMVLNLLMDKPLRKYGQERLHCEEIEFILEWAPEDKSLSDIRIVLWKAFEAYTAHLTVYKIKKANSISLLCFGPPGLMSILAFKARSGLTLLQDMGVISLRIGYYILLDHKQRDQTIQSLKQKIIELEDESHQAVVIDTSPQKEDIEETTIVESMTVDVELQRKQELELKKLNDFLLKSENEQVRMAGYLFMENENLKEQVQRLADQSHEIKKAYNIEKERVESLQKTLIDKDNEIQELKKCLANEGRKLTETETNWKGKLEAFQKISRARTFENERLTREAEQASANIAEKDKKFEERMKQLQNELDKAKSEAMQRIPLANHNKPELPPVDFLMGNFSMHKKDDKYWDGPAFLSHPDGYQMCFRVRANGYNDGKGSHVTVCLYLMRGANDDSLKWPLNASVLLELRNQENEEDGPHVSYEFYFDETKQMESSRVYEGINIKGGKASNLPLLCSKFISHAELENGYLEDDTLKFRIVEVVMKTPPETIQASPQSSSVVSPFNTFIPIEFTINKVSQRMKWFFGSDWTSPYFYSHPGGYKFVFIVYPNGVGSSKDRSVSAYFHLARGSNDGRLKFPFRGHIVVELVNTIEDKNHHQHVVKFDDETDPIKKFGERVWKTSRAFKGLGINDFISHKDLLEFNPKHNTKFLQDDSLKIRIVDIKRF